MHYECPYCNAIVSMNNGIVLIGESGDERSLFQFDTRPGHYNYNVATKPVMAPGQIWEFICPMCHHNLTTPENDRLAELKMISGKEQYSIYFSKAVDERATFVAGDDKLVPLGEHSQDYLGSEE